MNYEKDALHLHRVPLPRAHICHAEAASLLARPPAQSGHEVQLTKVSPLSASNAGQGGLFN